MSTNHRKSKDNRNDTNNISPNKRCRKNNYTISSWTNNDYTEGDSIFTDIVIDENISKLIDSNDFDEDFVLQSTQKFIQDLTIKPNLEQSFSETNSFYGSQYETRESLRNKTLRNQINEIRKINWCSQEFREPIKNITFATKGEFYGLPKKVENMIYEQKGIKNLYDWQKECLQLPAIQNRKNLLYALPTSGGKTLVAEILMLREILCRNKNVLFILPYVSIVQEKVSAMGPFAYNLDFLVEEYTAGKGRCPPIQRRKRKSIFISSIEKGAVLFDSLIEAERANEIGLIVVDELHLMGEKGRGSTLESFLTKVMFIKAGIQIIGMSATIGNLPELSEFLDADVYSRSFRPVELKEYIKCGSDILQINSNGKTVEEIFSHHKTIDFKYSVNIAKADPDHLAGLVSEVIPNESCLIFCPTRKNCENVALLLTRILLRKRYTEHRKAEKESLMDAIEKMCGTLSPTLKETIPYGIAYHHSGLTTDERKILETAYRFGTLCVICCTSTLAAGVNLPAKRVLIRAPFVGREFMTLCQYKQMVGRAGRAGLGTAGESFLICSSKDNFQVGQMLFSPMDEIHSSLIDNDGIGLQSLILSSIGLNLADCLKDLIKLTDITLQAIQAKRFQISIETEVTKMLRNMFKHKILKIKSGTNTILSQDIITTQEIKNQHQSETIKNTSKLYILSKSTKFELSMIGRAAFKAGIDYKRTGLIYNELKSAQKNLILTNFNHLLYLVISFSSNDDFLRPEITVFFREYNTLDADTQNLLKVLGVTDAHAIKMAKTMSLKGPVEIQLSRFFKVLILNEILNMIPIHLIAMKFDIERGMIQNLLTQTISATGSIIRLCEQIEEFWCYTSLFEKLSDKLDHCCTAELVPLLDLPAVKINRAKQLFAAGYKTVEDVAKAKPEELMLKIEYLSQRLAKEMISTAKVILINKLEMLQEQTENIINCLK